MKFSISQLLLYTSVAQAATTAQLIGGDWVGWSNIKTIFAFGNSYTDIGFKPGVSKPTTSNPLGVTPAKPFLDDKWISYLTTNSPGGALTYDLAISGAVVDTTLIPTSSKTASLTNELSIFKSTYAAQASAGGGYGAGGGDGVWKADSTLFTIFIGINDVVRSGNDASLVSKWDDIFGVYANITGGFYEAGARHFLLLGVPAMDKAPGAKPTVQSLVADWNKRVKALASNLVSAHKGEGASVWFFDTAGLFSEIIENPSVIEATKGIKNTWDACSAYAGNAPTGWDYKAGGCKTSYGEHFWRDGLHVTGRVHEGIAAQIALGLEAGGGVETQQEDGVVEVERRVRRGRGGWRLRGRP